MKEIMDSNQLVQQTHFFKMLGDLNRVKIMHVLMRYDRLCVNEISQFIDATIATTSHHLIILKNSGIIRSEKEGKHMIYSLENQPVSNLIELARQLKARCPKCGRIHD